MPLYFVRAGKRGPVKIGYSIDMGGRMQQMRKDNHCELEVLRLVNCSRACEREAHRRFKKLRLRREWFKFHEHMMTWKPRELRGLGRQPRPKIDLDGFMKSIGLGQ